MAGLTQKLFRVCLIVALLVPTMTRAASATDVALWTYHNFPPFIVDEDAEEGLSFDLARRMTEMSDGAYEFEVTILARQRLNQYLADGDAAAVIWVNPVWFQDRDQTKYLWTGALVGDKNAVISPSARPVEFTGPDAAHGRIFAGVVGHRYSGLEPLFSSGAVDRIELSSYESQVLFVSEARADFAVLPDAAGRYFAQHYTLQDSLHFSSIPHSRYDRMILVQPGLTDVHGFLSEAVAKLAEDPAWQDRLRDLGFSPPQ